MNDLFSSPATEQDIFAGDQGSTPSGEPSGGPIIPPTSTDNVDSSATPTSGQPSDAAATAGDQGQPQADDTGQASTGAPDQGQDVSQLTEEQLQKMEQDADAALGDERTPKWFKNVLGQVYKPKLQQYQTQIEQYSAFGAPEEVGKRLALVDSLYEVRSDPNTGMPVNSTENFVENLYKENPEVAYQLMADLATRPSPVNPGLTVTEELLWQMGIDPKRINDIQQFAQNGYSLTASQFAPPDAEDLASIPQQYHATFSKLDPETRNSLLADDERVRNMNLEGHRIRIAHEEQQQTSEQQREAAEREQQETQQRQFVQQVEAKGQENFNQSTESVFNSFVDSLTKQANMSKMDALMITNTVLNALEPTLAGRQSMEVLKAEGIELDAQIPQIIGRLEELTKHAAYYQLTNDQQNLTSTVTAINEQQEKLIAKGNKVIAALALKRNGTVTAPAQQLNRQVAATQTNRHAIAGAASAGVNSGQRPPRDFSDESYAEALGQDPFFRR